MNIIVLDDEKIALEIMEDILKECVRNANIKLFRYAKDAIDYAKETLVDIAFVDVEMFDLDGIYVAKKLREINNRINIVFTTGYEDYTGEAMKMHASGYILKPITQEKIIKELQDLRYKPGVEKEKILANTFGNFELFFRTNPVKFKYSKTKEMLAYLIDRRGAMCSNGELMAVLWEEEGDMGDKTSYLKNIKADATNTFKKLGLNNILAKRRGAIGIVTENISCDYYDYLINGKNSKFKYSGEYMTAYSWAEMTNAYLAGLNIGEDNE